MGDPNCTKMCSQIGPGISGGGSNLIADIVGQSQSEMSLGHVIQQVPSLLVSTSCSGMSAGPLNNPPEARGLEKCLHLEFPLQIVCPIKDGDVGGNRTELRRPENIGALVCHINYN